MGSVQELEAQNAIERKRLMQALLDYLNRAGVTAEIEPEPAINSLGLSVLEPVIHLQKQNLSKIRLVGMDSGSCGAAGIILRFQYEVRLEKNLPGEMMESMNATTRLIKEGKIRAFFGGKITGIQWEGQKLADVLNQDQAISSELMKCVKAWSHLEFQIEAASPEEVHILGPRFTNPGMIAELYQSGIKDEIEGCVFGYPTLEKIAKHIKAIKL